MTPEQINIIPNPSFTMDDKGNLVPTQSMPAGAQIVTPGDNTQGSPYESGANGGKVNTGTPETNTPNITGNGQGSAFKTPDYAAPAATQDNNTFTEEQLGKGGDITDKTIGPSQVTTDPEPSIWTKGFSKDAVKQSGKSIADAYNDYNKWAKENGKDPLDFMEVWAMYNNKDLNKSVEQNELDDKKAKHQENWERIGNFLSHLANFIGTTQGAPSQQLESGQELTKRQQALRDKTLAQRQSTARDMIAAYRQIKDAELAAKNQEYKTQLLDAQIKEKTAKINDLEEKREIERFKAETDRQFKNASIDVRYKALEIQQKLAEKRITIAEANTEISRLRAENEASDKKHVKKTKKWNPMTMQYEDVTEETTISREKPNRSSNQQGTSGNGNQNSGNTNTSPPSRRATDNNTNNDNTPPSRRKK